MDDVDKAIFQEEIKEYIKEKIYKMTLKKLCEILWDQTSEKCFVKVQAVEKFKYIEESQDPVNLTLVLCQVAYNVQYKT